MRLLWHWFRLRSLSRALWVRAYEREEDAEEKALRAARVAPEKRFHRPPADAQSAVRER